MNKQDLPGAMSVTEVQDNLEIRSLSKQRHPIATFPLSAIAADEHFAREILPAFTWLHKQIKYPCTEPAEARRVDSGPSSFVAETKASQPNEFDPRSPEVLSERVTSWILRAADDIPDPEFLEQFRTYTLTAWDHYTHIRIAYVILTTFGRQKGERYIHI